MALNEWKSADDDVYFDDAQLEDSPLSPGKHCRDDEDNVSPPSPLSPTSPIKKARLFFSESDEDENQPPAEKFSGLSLK